jgi:hypothetical protein
MANAGKEVYTGKPRPLTDALRTLREERFTGMTPQEVETYKKTMETRTADFMQRQGEITPISSDLIQDPSIKGR